MSNKKQLIEHIVIALKKELQQAIDAANEAHAAAVDDQSVAETQYDTLAIEASYLAEGLSRRVTEFQHAIDAYNALELVEFNVDSYITLGALVQLSADEKANHWFFIGPAAGGFRYQLDQKSITVITPQSPMGIALIGKQQDDDIEIMLGANKLEDYVSSLK
ncbi:membrane protein [Colwellia psychrerythraea]|uniref:Transcription elongation factor GreA/GreB domain-containing protein n=1 Tax=Colwellia psychrerythraea TaxID=28229 RepID=A0A099KC98_COLPS|nr:membrane protein [Colwellia psychrerythraea]KGJ87981.1 transcription elongation factor GreA/GreB domain-containing protein [Colwellia psychrerythraea]